MGWKTHTEGGSWDGGGTEVPNCNGTERAAITTGIAFMRNSILPGVNAAGGRAVDLRNALNNKTVETVEIDCRGPSCNANVFGTAPRGGSSINMCALGLPPGGTQADTDVTLFHELIHSCGGNEIDSWAFENHFYVGHGTINPGSDTVDGFRGQTSDVGGGLRASEFVVWEPTTGRVFVKVETGGSWNSGPTITRGTELNVNRNVYMRP
ncbi:MAG: hypothetical protein HOV80_33765 [Polyangiaceae bacterium]|nr:hypothetical protein [Polyangiaceae bacterium]